MLVLSSFAIDNSSLFVTSKGSISFTSDAPLELIQAKSQNLKGILDAQKKVFAFSVSMKSFQGFNSPLQRQHFNENYIESEKFPKAIFKGKIVEDIDFTKDGVHQVHTKGKFIVHGIESMRNIPCTVKIENGQVTILSKFTVPLSDHNITIPKIVYQKIATEINVTIFASMKKR